MPLSLWLVPPESDSDEIASTMRAVASAHLLPSSAPHVTLLGDASGGGNDERALHEAVQRLISLGERWTGGAVVCEFTEIYGSDVWNQSGVAIMRETRQLLELQRLARCVFFSESIAEAESAPAWALPLRQPHLSLIYGGCARVLSELTLPKPFVADTIALWDCTPADLAGVPLWREVAKVKLAGKPGSAQILCTHKDFGMISGGGTVGVVA